MRYPRGYVGRHHETLGADILAVLAVVSLPKETLGDSVHRQLLGVRADQWYPISTLLELMNTLEERVGANALRQMGKKLFEQTHAEHAKQVAKSAWQMLSAFDLLYRRANRGEDIGGWSLTAFEPGRATLEKTTPHHCALEEGILVSALNCVGVPATVKHEQCVRKNADSCLFTVTSFVTDERWSHGQPALE